MSDPGAPPLVYVDDEPALCRVMKLVLEQAGLRVVCFSDPGEALAFMEREPVALVMCDQRMPHMTGLELLARVRQDVPYVLVTGDYSFRAEAEADPRVRAIVEKPFKYAELVALLRALLDE